MANWSIENMERQASDGLVTKVRWTVTVVKNMEFANKNGDVELERGDSFISFDQLTKAQVLNWVWEKIDKAAIEAELDIVAQAKIDARTHNFVAVGLPWSE